MQKTPRLEPEREQAGACLHVRSRGPGQGGQEGAVEGEAGVAPASLPHGTLTQRPGGRPTALVFLPVSMLNCLLPVSFAAQG